MFIDGSVSERTITGHSEDCIGSEDEDLSLNDGGEEDTSSMADDDGIIYVHRADISALITLYVESASSVMDVKGHHDVKGGSSGSISV